MALYSFSEVFVWDVRGGFVQLARNQRVYVNDPGTGVTAAGLTDSGGNPAPFITSDADGRVTFSADIPTVRPVVNGDTLPDVTSPDAIGGGGTVSDATTTSKGVVQLAGDLGGTAAAPTVPGLAGKANTSHTHTASQISDSTATGRSVVTAVDAAAARAAIGAGTSSLALGTTAGTALDASTAPELIRDTMGTALVAGSNVTITPSDAGDTITIAASGGGAGGVTGALAPVSTTLYWQMLPYSGYAAGVGTAGSEQCVQMPLGAQTFAAISTWIEAADPSGAVIVGFRKYGTDGLPGAVEAQVAIPATATGRSTVTGLSLALSGGLYAVCWAVVGALTKYRPSGHSTSTSAAAFLSFGGGLHTVGALESNKTVGIVNGNAPGASTLAATFTPTSSVSPDMPPILAVRRSA